MTPHKTMNGDMAQILICTSIGQRVVIVMSASMRPIKAKTRCSRSGFPNHSQ